MKHQHGSRNIFSRLALLNLAYMLLTGADPGGGGSDPPILEDNVWKKR